MKIVPALLFSALLAVTALSQTLSVDPPDPMSNEDVILTVKWQASCVQEPTVARSGFEIVVTLHAGLCGAPPLPVTQSIDLGTLAPGQYSVTIYGFEIPGPFRFTVFDANGRVTVKQSIGSASGGTKVKVTVAGGFCTGGSSGACAAPAVTFGGVPATDVVVVDGGHLEATTPAHAPGAVQVLVKGDSANQSSFAFRYYDPEPPASARLFEKILIPTIINGAGATGSNWETELWLRNNNDFTVEPWRPIAGSSAIAPAKPLQLGSGNQPEGALLVVPRDASAGLTFQETVRDTSRADHDFGTQIPIVRDLDALPSFVELLGIPVDARYRLTLRIYSPVSVKLASVLMYSMDDGVFLRSGFYVPMSDATDEHPAFGSAANFVATTSAKRIGLRIGPALGFSPIWAFVTVTDNVTQHVTVISPH